MHWLVTVVLVAVLAPNAAALDNGLARTPPMGWLSWERFRCNVDCDNDPRNCISARLYKEMADELVAGGYAKVGYNHVNVDDCFLAKHRNAEGKLYADPTRFPGGIPALSKYVHDQGLKLGVYTDIGATTCAGYPGSEGHFAMDARTWVDEWNVDMLKMDGCNYPTTLMAQGYPNVTRALNATGRPIVFSCSWPDYVRISGKQPDYSSVAQNCNLWRLYDDIQDSWDSVAGIIAYWGDNSDMLAKYAAPGAWNDMDMLIIGNSGLNDAQSRAQMAIWSILASPLLMSNDLRNISAEAKAILTNTEVIAVDQDPLGRQGVRLWRHSDGGELWARQLQGNEVAVVLFNNGDQSALNITFTPAVDLPSGWIPINSRKAVLRDLFEHHTMPFLPLPSGSITANSVAQHDVRMYRLTFSK